jgi:chromosome segregation ATPase
MLALDLPRFMQSNNKEKAETLLRIIGVGDKLFELERKETEIYNRRTAIGQIKDQKEKYAKEQIYYPDAPKEPVSASELIQQQQEILAQNGENQKKRDNLKELENDLSKNKNDIQDQEIKIKDLENQIQVIRGKVTDLYEKQVSIVKDVELAKRSTADLHDESTAELEANLADIEAINVKVRANLDKDKAEQDAQYYANQYNTLSSEIDTVRQEKIDLLKRALFRIEMFGYFNRKVDIFGMFFGIPQFQNRSLPFLLHFFI